MERTTSTGTDAGAAAFARHVEPEIEVLLRVAQSLTGSWSEAEDLVQETMIRAYKGIGGFDGAHPRAWLLTIMRRANVNAHRRQRPATADPTPTSSATRRPSALPWRTTRRTPSPTTR